MVGDNREMHERLLKKFLANAERQVPGICEALSVCEVKKAVALAHTLKSAARSVGALALGELCQHIETAGNAGDSLACATLAADLPVTFAVAMQAIREHLAL